MIIFGFVTLASLCSLFSCDGNDIIQPETPSIINNEVVNVSEFVDSRGFEQVNNTYCVTRDDASELSNILRPDQEFTIEPFVVKEDTLLYIVNYEDGWIIIAGDKRINPIVAESDKGSISMQIDNDNLITWIDSYADEINVIRYYGKEEENEYTKLWSRVIANKRKTARMSEHQLLHSERRRSCNHNTRNTPNHIFPFHIQASHPGASRRPPGNPANPAPQRPSLFTPTV